MSEINLPKIGEKKSLNKIYSAEAIQFNKYIKNDIQIEHSRYDDFKFQKNILKENSSNKKKSFVNIPLGSDTAHFKLKNSKIKTIRGIQQINSRFFPIKTIPDLSEKSSDKNLKEKNHSTFIEKEVSNSIFKNNTINLITTNNKNSPTNSRLQYNQMKKDLKLKTKHISIDNTSNNNVRNPHYTMFNRKSFFPFKNLSKNLSKSPSNIMNSDNTLLNPRETVTSEIYPNITFNRFLINSNSVGKVFNIYENLKIEDVFCFNKTNLKPFKFS